MRRRVVRTIRGAKARDSKGGMKMEAKAKETGHSRARIEEISTIKGTTKIKRKIKSCLKN